MGLWNYLLPFATVVCAKLNIKDNSLKIKRLQKSIVC